MNRSGYVSIRDRAGPFWALGLFLLAGGVMAVALPLGTRDGCGSFPSSAAATLAEGCLEATTCCQALAAAEVIAALEESAAWEERTQHLRLGR